MMPTSAGEEPCRQQAPHPPLPMGEATHSEGLATERGPTEEPADRRLEDPLASTSSNRSIHTQYRLNTVEEGGGLLALPPSRADPVADGASQGRRFRRGALKAAKLGPRKVQELTQWLSQLAPRRSRGHDSSGKSIGRSGGASPRDAAAAAAAGPKKPPQSSFSEEQGLRQPSSSYRVDSSFWQRLGRERFPGERQTRRALRRGKRKSGGWPAAPEAPEQAPERPPPAAAAEATAKLLVDGRPRRSDPEPESPTAAAAPATRPPCVFSANFEGSWAQLVGPQTSAPPGQNHSQGQGQGQAEGGASGSEGPRRSSSGGAGGGTSGSGHQQGPATAAEGQPLGGERSSWEGGPLGDAARQESFRESGSHVSNTTTLTVDTIKGCTFVNQYLVVGTLGRGAYGKVKLCLDTATHQLYALKLVRKGPSQSARLRRKLTGGSRSSLSQQVSGLSSSGSRLRTTDSPRASAGSVTFQQPLHSTGSQPLHSTSSSQTLHSTTSQPLHTTTSSSGGEPSARASPFTVSQTLTGGSSSLGHSQHSSREPQQQREQRGELGSSGSASPRRAPLDLTASLSKSLSEDAAREIALMRRFDHPNLVKLMEVIDDPHSDKVLLVLEYVEGGTLAFNTRAPHTTRLPEPVTRQFFRDIVQGLDCMHCQSVAHCDLKPDNLLLGGDGKVRLADFGSAVQCGRAERVVRTSGTPAFFAPEMCDGRPYSPFLADMWALGVCLFKFTYGELPFRADAVMQLYDEIQGAPLVLPASPAVSPELQALIRGLLAKDPAQRLTLCAAMSHAWTTAGGAQPLTCTQTGGCPVRALETAKACPLESMMGVVSSLFQERTFAPGEVLAQEGTPATQVFYVEEGWVSVASRMRGAPDEDLVDDEDSEADSDVEDLGDGPAAAGAAPAPGGAGDPGHVSAPSRCALKSQALYGGRLEDWRGSGAKFEERSRRSLLERSSSRPARSPRMLAIMLAAARSASITVPCQMTNAKLRIVLTGRGKGTFISEVAPMQPGGRPGAGHFGNWKTTVRAATEAKVLVLAKEKFWQLLAQRPEVEAAMRAAIATRKAELLKLEALERVAGLRDELEREFAVAQELASRLSRTSTRSDGSDATEEGAVEGSKRLGEGKRPSMRSVHSSGTNLATIHSGHDV